MSRQDENAHIFEFKKENAKELAHMIKTLLFREANAYLDSSIFTTFFCKENDLKLKVPLKTIAECLNICEGTVNSAKMSYAGFYDPMRILVEETDGPVIRAKIHVLVPEQELDFEFSDDNVTATCLMKTQLLKEIFKDFDASSRTVVITFDPNKLEFSTNGDVGEMIVSIPTRSLQMEKMDYSGPISHRYRLTLIQRMIPVITLGTKVILRIDDRGVLCAQFTVEHGDNKNSYIEFLTVPDDENFTD
ncbi:unnamed protein product [Caenorhabditis bovis]|uniref:Proliferating cell nuclear antigen n=1 Tax=Caenorhabditis bovis TaxID=2654633 RepID=A0A8S1EPN8_9PELO|nr:unnamed protein product [Caenorhabditis bovis]